MVQRTWTKRQWLRHIVVTVGIGGWLSSCGTPETPRPVDSMPASVAGCGIGLSCAPPDALCCIGSRILRCENGVYVDYATCPDSFGPCAGKDGLCQCAPADATACKDENTMLVCKRVDDKTSSIETSVCGKCDVSKGFCTDSCIDTCIKGEMRCSDDSTAVTLCQRAPMNNYCLTRVDAYFCAENGMICDDQITNVNNGFQYCVNECGVPGVPLEHRVCDLVAPTAEKPEPDCGFWICNIDGTLVPDRQDCRLGGEPCTSDKDCKSCTCNVKKGRCEGGSSDGPPARCPDVMPICAAP